jgi:hypothetical protein
MDSIRGTAQARGLKAHGPAMRILLPADAGFARDGLMTWCETNGVDFLFGLARNSRLVGEIDSELAQAREESQETGRPVGTTLQGVLVVDARQLEPRAPGRAKAGGRMDRGRGQSAL